jgi:hypothetical protein
MTERFRIASSRDLDAILDRKILNAVSNDACGFAPFNRADLTRIWARIPFTSCLSKIDRPAAFELRLGLGRAFLRIAPEGKPIK